MSISTTPARTDDYVPDQPTPTSTPNPCPGLYTKQTEDGVSTYVCHTSTETPPPLAGTGGEFPTGALTLGIFALALGAVLITRHARKSRTVKRSSAQDAELTAYADGDTEWNAR